MPTLATLLHAVPGAPGAMLREVATQAPSLRPLGLRADEIARRALRELQAALPTETASGILARLDLPATTRSVSLMRELGFGYDRTELDSRRFGLRDGSQVR